VMTCGIATYVMSVSTLDSLTTTLDEFYQDYRFAQVFAPLKRAPEFVAGRIESIEKVDVVETRVVAAANLDIEGYDQPVQGQLISLPDDGDAKLNRLFLVDGRMVNAYRDDEVILSDAFAEAHQFVPGDKLRAVINGRRKQLTIVGTARSPEYIYQLAPGSIIPDFERFGILWMGRTPLATAFDMKGAFNDLTFTLAKDADIEPIIEQVDLILAPFGGLGAYGREDQQSHFYLSEEFRQLEQMATIFPLIFLGVAAFLLNVVVNRLVQTQREQVAVLKAFGYDNLQIGLHFIQLISCIALLGVVAGVIVGIQFGQGLAQMYMEYYRFPYLRYELNMSVVLAAFGISAIAAYGGTIAAVRRAAGFPPAEAMRPEPPASYRQSFVERLGLKRWFTQPTRMIVRHLGRHPVKASLAVAGIACACGLLLMGRFFGGAMDFMMEVQYTMAQRDDVMVTYVEPAGHKTLYSLNALPGVEYGEVFRAAAVRLRNKHHEYRIAIQGVQPGGDLFRLLNTDLDVVDPPTEGLVIPIQLGSILEVEPGDTLIVEVLEGSRPVRTVAVEGFIEQYIGMGAYMHIDALNRLLGEGPIISGAFLATDAEALSGLYQDLKDVPRVAGVLSRMQAIEDFYENMGSTMLVFAFFYTLFAAAIAFAIIYNSARIALSERARELASLRILGFTRGEISYILLGELALLTVLGILVGFAVGWALCYYIATTLQTELIRFPFVMTNDSYAFSALIVLVAAVLTGLIVRRRLYRLDLISVLKTRE
ncbi:MAG: ABC transporter permease, partial [Rhodothermales bacterium]|nr:ABC transporter permease [Rhodothermales bacterium]